MPSYRSGAVTEVLSERPGLQRVLVDGERAYVLTALIGQVAVGDRVVMNTTAVELGLGTGGWHVVHWNLEREAWSQAGPGHIMKLRYTSLQADTGAGEEASAGAAEFPPVAHGLDGMPVVACSLHSQVAAVAAAFKAVAPSRRLVYVMTDGASLPLALSDLVASLLDAGLIDATITAGQAFGGDVEAVNVYSALVLARGVEGADAVVAGIGPGVIGTGTRLGHTGLDVVSTVHAIVALGGTPIVAARHSDADERPRHRGRSHHTETALALLRGAGVQPLVPDPAIERPPDAGELLAAHGITVTTMGRTAAQDPAAFAWPAAAGVVAARMASSGGGGAGSAGGGTGAIVGGP